MDTIDSVKKFLNEFKEFSFKKDAMAMALGIVLGVSFGKVVTSLVNDIITPPIGFILGGVTFPDLKIVLKPAVMIKNRVIDPEVAIHYGRFLQAMIDFLLVAFGAFIIIKFVHKVLRAQDADSVDWTQYIKKEPQP